jgi:hypothetical protein
MFGAGSVAGARDEESLMGALGEDGLAIGDPVHCECGHELAQALGDTYIVVADHRVPFRRRTDYLLCDACGASYPVQVLRAMCRPAT